MSRPNVTTEIETRAELDAWLANPTTTADIKNSIDLSGDDLVVSDLRRPDVDARRRRHSARRAVTSCTRNC